MNKFVSYEGLPVSAGGAHGLGKKTVSESYADTLEFLKTYADTFFPHEVNLTLYKDKSFNYRQLKWKLMKQFGLFPKSSSWNMGDYKQKFWTWRIESDKVADGLDILVNNSDLPEHPFGPLTMSILWHFKFVDPLTKRRIPNQESIPTLDSRIHNSRALLTLKKKSTLSVWFAFPFTNEDEEFKTYIKELVKHLPFKPSDKHWRLWTKSEVGNWTPKKVEVNTRQTD